MENELKAKLAIGTVQFGINYGISNIVGQTNENEVRRILDYSYQEGINTLDTAQAYGESEKVLGQNNCSRFDVVTKIAPNELDKKSVAELIDESRIKLNVEMLYGVLFHNAESALANPKKVEELAHEKHIGSVKKIGYSVYTPDELLELIDLYGQPDLIQIPFSHLDDRFSDLALNLHSKGVEIHTRSTFLQGLFFVEPKKLSDFFNPIKEYLSSIQREYNETSFLASSLLKAVLLKPFIDKVVIGVNNLEQLIGNIVGLETAKTIEAKPPKNINSEILMPNLWPKH